MAGPRAVPSLDSGRDRTARRIRAKEDKAMMTAARRSRRATRTVLGALVALGLTAGLATPTAAGGKIGVQGGSDDLAAAAGVKLSDIIVTQSTVASAEAPGEPEPTADPSAVQKVREAANRAVAPAQP